MNIDDIKGAIKDWVEDNKAVLIAVGSGFLAGVIVGATL